MSEPKTELIVIRQLPIIEERLRSMSEDIDKTVNEAKSLVCTEETVKSVKVIRSDLTKQFNALEEQRKAVRSAVLAPYEAFDKVYKECVSDKFKSADADLKKKIDDVESDLKDKKAAEAKAYFEEYAALKSIDFVSFDRTCIQVTLSTSLKALKGAAKDFLDKVSDELALIDTQEHKAEILVEYKASLNVAAAITKVSARHAAIAEEREKQEEMSQRKQERLARAEQVKAASDIAPPEVLSPPQEATIAAPVEDKQYEASFTVYATMDKLRALKAFLVDGGYRYESK